VSKTAEAKSPTFLILFSFLFFIVCVVENGRHCVTIHILFFFFVVTSLHLPADRTHKGEDEASVALTGVFRIGSLSTQNTQSLLASVKLMYKWEE
jgi:hypothetical protein